MEPQDAAELQDKTSLTPSEGTEPGSPARFARAHSLSPEPSPWASSTIAATAAAATTTATAGGGGEGEGVALSAVRRDGDRAAPGVYSRAEEELAHYDFLAQLRKASHGGGLLDSHSHNGSGTYQHHVRGVHDDTPPTCWSPGEHESPDGRDGVPLSPDALRGMLACPFCQRTYRREPALREHIKFCHERDEGQNVCPICGFSTPYRAQMERHMLLHSQAQDKVRQPLSDPAMENRKFKCMQCGKAFKYKHHLKEHLRIHSGEKPYECSNCKKRFSHSGSYSSHLSSKKCLNGGAAGGAGATGGGGGGGPGGGVGPFNGHHHPAYLHSPTSPPPAAGGRNSGMGKGSPYAQERQPGHLSADHHPGLQQDQVRGQDLNRLWDPTAELSLRASVFKGTTLLPYLHSGSKFEHLLQEMLRREVQRQDGGPLREEERPTGRAGREARGSPEGRPGEGPAPGREGGVTCRWCSQLFPNGAVLLQHERYLCKMSRGDSGAAAAEALDNHRPKDGSPLNFSRPAHGPQGPPKTPTSVAAAAAAALSNGFPKERSPLQRSPWQAVPQQLLVALHSPMQSGLPARPYWPNPELGSPGGKTPVSPAAAADMPSPTPLQDRRRLLSSGFASPLGLDLSNSVGASLGSPPSRAAPHCRTPGSAGSQNEPLDLSLPKHQALEHQRERHCNGTPRAERRDSDGPYRRLSPPPQPLPGYGGAPPLQPGAPAPFVGGAPMFGGSVYGAYPLFNPMIPAGLRGAGHENMPSLPVSRATPNAFLSPMAYMLDSDTESVLKRIHQERQALMSEALNRGCLDYLSVMEDGLDGDGGPGRKRLRKTEEGLYACDICDKTFQKSSSLLRHKYEHTGKRPHECKICKKAFKHKHHLIEHSRLHSGEKPYQCDKCGKRFSHSGSYSQHMNHRYAYCSRDHDTDTDGPAEEASMGDEPRYPRTPGLDLIPEQNAASASANAISTTPEETSNFLSDSSLDGGLRGEEEEEEEEEDEEDEEDEVDERALGNHREELRADSGVGAEDLRGSPSLGRESASRSQEERDEQGGGSRLSNGGGGGGGGRADTDGEENDHCDPNEEDAAMELTAEKNDRSPDARCEEEQV
ncbi:zinc finger E-box-binding homeobox 2-like isoform X2 [Sardina pilchardus]|uniref:zinc finger E-box-binding homeobox 2-like isoform X2 n=1 Tax=Sardina pilchardus TaxID=27697 RepID=UPI002E0D8286